MCLANLNRSQTPPGYHAINGIAEENTMDAGTGDNPRFPRPGHVPRPALIHVDHPGIAWHDQMDHHNVSQARMARQTGVSAKHVNMICKGKALPSADLVVKMARVLKVNDPKEAQHTATVLWNLQTRYVLTRAFLALRGWRPQFDALDRSSQEREQP